MRRVMLFGIGLLTGLALAYAVPYVRAHEADQVAKIAPPKNPLFVNMT